MGDSFNTQQRNLAAIRFDGVITAGNLIMVFSALVPLIVWGIRLEGRVDQEALLRARLEVAVTDNRNDRKAEDDRIQRRITDATDRVEVLLNKINNDLTDVKIAVGVGSRPKNP